MAGKIPLNIGKECADDDLCGIFGDMAKDFPGKMCQPQSVKHGANIGRAPVNDWEISCKNPNVTNPLIAETAIVYTVPESVRVQPQITFPYSEIMCLCV